MTIFALRQASPAACVVLLILAGGSPGYAADDFPRSPEGAVPPDPLGEVAIPPDPVEAAEAARSAESLRRARERERSIVRRQLERRGYAPCEGHVPRQVAPGAVISYALGREIHRGEVTALDADTCLILVEGFGGDRFGSRRAWIGADQILAIEYGAPRR